MTRLRRVAATLIAAAALVPPAAVAQEAEQATQVVIDRGLTDDMPYTAIYPEVLELIDDGSPATILSLQHPGAVLRCDIFAVPGGEAGWSAEAAVERLDVAAIESTWAPDFPGFTLVDRSVVPLASGPGLLYEGESDTSPLGVPVRVVHAEAVTAERTYAVECLMDKAIAAEARPLVDFVIANFSTRSDGECCVVPDPRG